MMQNQLAGSKKLFKESDMLLGLTLNGNNRYNITIGNEVNIIQKKDQRSGKLTHGFVSEILINSRFLPHGIKVRLSDGHVGRVQEVLKKSKNN